MKKINKFILIFFTFFIIVYSIKFVLAKDTKNIEMNKKDSVEIYGDLKKEFDYEINPKTLEINVICDSKKEQVSKPLQERIISNYKEENNNISFDYENEGIHVNLKKEKDYIDIDIKSTKNENKFTWPKVSANSYTLPLFEGKYIPSNDKYWKEFLKDSEYSFAESFSMNYFVSNKENYSIMYIAKNMLDNEIKFNTDDKIEFDFIHDYPSIEKEKTYGFRIYITNKNIMDISKLYKNHIISRGKFKTLEEKAKSNPNIKKLYGSIFIYLWSDNFLWSDDIKWQEFLKNMNSDVCNYIRNNKILETYELEELNNVFEELKQQDYLSKYQKDIIIRDLNKILKSDEFYDESIFAKKDDVIKSYIKKGLNNLNQLEIFDLNKRALYNNFDVFNYIKYFGNGNSLKLLDELDKMKINNAWLGFADWIPSMINPKFNEIAIKRGYLVAPYDSYHSIHEVKDNEWITASFDDERLYYDATITNKNNKKIGGFLGRGRKLNPTLSMPYVKYRINKILDTGVKFNSWFLDVDGAGEFHNDYSKEHITTKLQDQTARLNRMKYIANDKELVLGTESGNDYCSDVIAFAHGIESPVLKWGDNDLRVNKESKYYLGNYWSNTGGVPTKYFKQVELKDLYKRIYYSPIYSLPLYKLVYNDSVITSHHWESGSLKFKEVIVDNMLYEILYNVPPLYQLDLDELNKHKNIIKNHYAVFSKFHKEAIKKPIKDFCYLTKDKLVQKMVYDENLYVIVNFSNNNYIYDGKKIEGKSVYIKLDNEEILYKPMK